MNETVNPSQFISGRKPATGVALAQNHGTKTAKRMSRRDREFLPAALAILETPPAPARSALMLTICAFAAVAIAWSFVGRLDVDAVASGKIEASSRTKVIQPLELGKISQIATENGQHVKKGDVLLRFDPTEALADQKNLTTASFAFRAEIIRRRAEIGAAKQIFEQFRTVNVPRRALDAHLVWPQEAIDIPADYRNIEEAIFTAEFTQLFDTLSILDRQLAQREAALSRLHASIDAQAELLKTLNDRVALRETLVRLDIGTKLTLFDALETLQRTKGSLVVDKGQVVEVEAAIGELKSQRARLFSQFIADNENKLSDAARRNDSAILQLDKAEARLQRTALEAPIDGIVQQLSVTTIGQVVSTGQQLMTITPENDRLQVQALVSNLDIGFIKVGQEAAIKVDAFPFTRFGTLRAKVVRIAADAVDEQEAKRGQANVIALSTPALTTASGGIGQPQSFVFLVTLELTNKAIRVGQDEIPVGPGMTVTAEIKTDSRRIIDYLLSPIAKIGSQAFRER